MPRKTNLMTRVAASACVAVALLSVLAWMVPSAGPTTVSAQSGGSLFVRKVSLTANDIVYSPSTSMLYTSVPSSVGASGNSITPINPTTGAVGAAVFVGSEPNRLAISADGNTLYTALDGASAIRQFDVQTQTPGTQFALGISSFYGPYGATDLAVAPGEPGTLAVARYNRSIGSSGGVAVFDNGVQRTKTGSAFSDGADFLAYSASASTLYGGGYSYGLRTMTIDATGVASVTRTTFSVGARVKFADGLVFSSTGQVINPSGAGTLLGTFLGVNTHAFVPDAAAGRAYYLVRDGSFGTTWLLKAFDVNTFLMVGSQTITGVTGDPTTLIRWGANGLAFRTSAGEVYVVQTSLIPSASPVPTPTPTPATTPSPTPSPTPVYVPTFIRKVSLPAGDVVYNEATQSLYASVASTAGAGGNSITPINPTTATAGAPVFIGSEPGRLALADDGRTLYAYLDGAKAVRRFDLQMQTAGIQFSVGTQTPADMEVMPGSPQTLAVSPGTYSYSSGTTIYDDGVARTKTGTGSFYVLPIEFGASPSVLYGYNSYTSGYELVKFDVDSSGLTAASVTSNLLSGYSTDIKFAGGRIYSSFGRIVDPEEKKLVGTFTGAGGAFAVDTALGRAFFLTGDGYSGNKVLKAFDLNTFLPLGSVTLQNIPGNATRMVRWGANGLALRTTNSSSVTPGDGGVYIIQSALVSTAEPIPTGVGLTTDKLTVVEYNSNLTVNVTRTGEVSSPTSVDYATSNGTATAGLDYTATSGTLTFAAGELSKTINVPIRQDNIFEGNETFTITFSNLTGGAVMVGPATASVTLNDDDSRPYLSINGLQVIESNTGTTEVLFQVTLSNQSVETVSVNYATSDGTASSGSDYVAASGTLTFPPLSTVPRTIPIRINGDLQIEPNETFYVNLSGAVNAWINWSQATGTIANDDAAGTFVFSAADYTVPEDGGSALITVRRLNGISGTVSVNYVTVSNTAIAGSDYTAASGTLTFAEGETEKTFAVQITNDTAFELNETITLVFNSATGGAQYGTPLATLTIVDDDKPLLKFTSALYTASESDGQAVVTVTRAGDPSLPLSVDYTTSDLSASERTDYIFARGNLSFAPGEASKSFIVLINQDSYAEGSEALSLTLSNPTGGATLSLASASLEIVDDVPESVGNPNDESEAFVRQHYHDFLNRTPDASGIQFWVEGIESCGSDKQCRQVKRIDASAAFFLSIEFQETGFLVHRLYKTAYGDATGQAMIGGVPRTIPVPMVRFNEFLPDSQRIAQDLIVGTAGWAERLQANKVAFAQEFVLRQRFTNTFGAGVAPEQFVDTLNTNAGRVLSVAEHTALVRELTGNNTPAGRASVLRQVAEHPSLAAAEKSRAFVLMQFFGYLRRNPNDTPDTNYDGYNFWLTKLNEFGGDFRQAQMVQAFIESFEYRRRFAP